MRADWLKIRWDGPLTEGLSFEERVAAVTPEQWAYVGRCFDGAAANMRRALADFEEGRWVPLAGGEFIAEAHGPGSQEFIAGLRDEIEQDHQPPEFVCPVCGAESWHPMDRRYGYCGRCHDYTGNRDQEKTR